MRRNQGNYKIRILKGDYYLRLKYVCVIKVILKKWIILWKIKNIIQDVLVDLLLFSFIEVYY